MRVFVTFAAVLVGLLLALVFWRGGDRPLESDAAAESEVTAPNTSAVVPPAPRPPAAPESVAESGESAAEPAARETASLPGVKRRAAEEKQLDRLRAEAARAIHASEEL